jgi:threonyl-tRNA synthetase
MKRQKGSNMPVITLPDGSKKEFEGAVTGLEVAQSIGEGLAKAALMMEVDGQELDMTTSIEADADIVFHTAKTEKGLETLRHSTAHILAQAIKELYPSAQITIGPVIENGFYYDISFEEKISDTDLAKIEERMKQIVKRDLPITREEWDRDEAVAFFKGLGEEYKAEIIGDLPENETISLYRQGEGADAFVDLCRGPHIPSTAKAGRHFKLQSIAGAYWRGDSKNAMLTRIYGTAWGSKDELKAYLHMLEESVKRDHRKIGPAMGLFHFQEEAMGQAFWHQKGWQVILTLQQYIRDKLKNTYQEVNTPQLVDHSLYLKSGHWEKFSNGEIFEVHDGDKISALKPMNCPCHIQIFNQGIKSYRDLPIRMSEFGTCMRNEAHGALHGLMRVRSMTQDDGHIFCTYDQITSEVLVLCKLIEEIYADFGFGDMRVKFSDRPEMRVGHDDVWDKSEQALKDACEEAGLEWTLNPGEGAFYGPKLEFVLKDCIGRDWQCGTVQLDFNMPERLDAKYIDENGDKQVPVMIHRALLGSLERFSGILIENFVGHFPLWLAPQQMVAMGITEKQNPAVEKLVAQLQGQGFRIEGDLRNEKVSYKIREHSLSKVPVQLVLGDREIENGTVTVRRLGSQKQTTMRMEEFIAAMHDEIKGKLLPIIEDSEAA